jgi:allantoin racemase
VRRILVVNSNTSETGTQKIAAGCEPHVRQGTHVDYVNVEAGPEGIDTVLDIAVSGVETVRTIASKRDAYDAFVVACANDPGLDAARHVTDKPVLGIAEAGMLFALPLGATFSLVTLLRSEIPLMREMAAHYGLAARLASVMTLDVTAAEAIGGQTSLYERFVAVGREAVERDMAEVIVLTGSVMCGIERDLSRDLGTPVVSGMLAAIKLAEDLIDLGLRTSRLYKYATPVKHDRLIGYEDLQAVYSASAQVAVARARE